MHIVNIDGYDFVIKQQRHRIEFRHGSCWGYFEHVGDAVKRYTTGDLVPEEILDKLESLITKVWLRRYGL